MASSAPEPNPLPAGVLAQVDGIQGPIRVVVRDGVRVLTIDGVVQGAAHEGGPQSLHSEPAVGLLRAFRANAKSALVIGLGTGRTASALRIAGVTVEVVELEPAVVDLARRFFGYEGPALLSHGSGDKLVPVRNVDMLGWSREQQGLPDTDVLKFGDSHHGLAPDEQMLVFTHAMEAHLKRYLGDPNAAQAA